MRALSKQFGAICLGAVLLAALPGIAAATDLTEAAKRGDNEAMAALLKAGADVNGAEPDGSTALHWAAYVDDVKGVELLLRKGADPMARTLDGSLPLTLAAMTGDATLLDKLIDAGADVNAMLPHGETALMMAAKTGSVKAIDLLLKKGAKINATENLRGTTALMWAAASSNADAVRELLKKGADYSIRSADTSLGRKPYLAQTAKSRIDQVKAGIDVSGTGLERAKKTNDGQDIDPNAKQDSKASEDSKASKESDDVPSYYDNSKKGGGLTAMIFAAREGDMASVKALLEAGADVNQTSHYGWTPLLTAVQNRYYKLAAYLLDHGADPNISNKGGWNPLYIATDNRNIEAGDYPTRKPDMDHLEFIKLLLAKGADVNARMHSSTETRTVFTNQWLHEEGATPFLRAAQSGDLVLMKLLLKHGADPSIATDQGVTPLMVASGIGWVEGVTYEWSPEETLDAVKLILSLGADVNAQDHVDRRTALMGAAHKGRNDVVQLLVDHGADLSLHDVGSRDTIHELSGVTWQAIDYADGLVRVGVQSAIPHPKTAALIRKLMKEKGLPVPPEGRTLDSICITEVCKGMQRGDAE